MISSNTLNTDNPKLNCRLKGFENFSPKRVILDKNLDINLNSYIFKTSKKNNTIIFHNSKNSIKKKILKKKGILLIKDKLNRKKVFHYIYLKKIIFLGIRNLLVEGGDKITNSMLKDRLINQFYLFKSPKILSKSKKYVIFTSNDILSKKYKIKSKIISNLAKDKITIYKR